MRRVLIWLVLAGFAVPAQAQHRSMSCWTAATTLQTGSLDAKLPQQKAISRIPSCSPSLRAKAISVALERRRALADPNDQNVAIVWALTRDTAVFQKLLQLVGDETVSTTARTLFIEGMMRLVDPRSIGSHLKPYLTSREGEVCYIDGFPHNWHFPGGPLPADSLERVKHVFLALERSAKTEPHVRSAAHCAMNLLRQREFGLMSAMGPFRARDYTVEAVCARRFRITSHARFEFAAQFRDRGKLRAVMLPYATSGNALGVMNLITEGDDPMKLFVDGTRIASVAASNKVCE